MKQLIVVLALVMLSGCATKISPVNLKWPDAPAELLVPAEDLTPLTADQTRLSDLLDNANTNFSKYYILKDKYDAWQSWYNSHKQIYQGAQ
jgi:uncharacterized lipoprotein YmbA